MARIAVDPPIHWHPNYASLPEHYGRIGALSILAARASAYRGRCVIPASRYYEWQTTSDGKQPYYITSTEDGPVLTIAGLWTEWRDRMNDETR
jgi:SOS response associated peptidase (SRAP)